MNSLLTSTKSLLCATKNMLARLAKHFQCYAAYLYRFILLHSHPLFVHICYFILISLIGHLLLRSIHLKDSRTNDIRSFDIFFTSVSAATISSMSTVEMEAFSNPQLLVLAVLMLIGGEVFTSTIGLQFRKQLQRQRSMMQIDPAGQFELFELDRIEVESQHQQSPSISSSRELKYNAIRYLTYLLMAYFLVVHVVGSVSVLLYVTKVSSTAREVLAEKKISASTFSVFTTISSFSNCGFIPTNENMMVFKKNTGLLLLLIPQVLLGNTLFPPCLRFLIWVLKRLTKREEFGFLLKSSEEIGYYHLLPYLHSVLLMFTVAGFLAVQLVLLRALEWHSDQALKGMSSYQKFIGALFLSVNSRHAGETVVDLSTLSTAILVLFVIMMYLPPYTSFLPIQEQRDSSRTVIEDKKRIGLVKSLVMSQLSYLAISVILICITERRKLSEDPLNFNVLNIVVEVISAYGNVGFSTGYSCGKQLKPDGNCKDAWYGFVGRWSTQGKLILIFVMFFGRLKKFSMSSGKAWKLG